MSYGMSVQACVKERASVCVLMGVCANAAQSGTDEIEQFLWRYYNIHINIHTYAMYINCLRFWAASALK